MFQGRLKSGSTSAGDKLVIFVHFFPTFANSSYSFDIRVMKLQRIVLWDHTHFSPQGQILSVQSQTSKIA